VQNGHLDSSLPVELDLALRSATWQALTSLRALRAAVRQHVDDECGRGCGQREIDAGLRSIIGSCAAALSQAERSPARTDEITIQVMKWSASYYRLRR
jgi:hypothetical protein